MAVKEVYAIRINKDDIEIKTYLEQFPENKHYTALKKLLKYGAERLQEDYVIDQSFNRLQETLQNIQETQEKKLDELMKLISNIQMKPVSQEGSLEEGEIIDFNKAKKSMEEALSMFTG
jgi:vacuolar-type H+-ATPase subunit E/Vma4